MYSSSSGRPAQISFDVGHDRLLRQVVANHVGDVSVDALVVRDARSGGIDHGHVAQLVGVHQPGDSEQGVLAEHQGIQEVVVDPPVDHIDPPQSGGGAHVDDAVVNQQVAALHQFRADLPGQEHVLVEGRVVDSGREQRDRRDRYGQRGRARAGSAAGRVRSARRPAPGNSVQPAAAGLDRLPVGEHVGDARGDAQVVLEDLESHRWCEPGRCRRRPPRPREGPRTPRISTRYWGQPRTTSSRNHAVPDDAGVAVDVVQKAVQGCEALRQTDVELPPLGAGSIRGTQSTGMMRSSPSSSP